MIGQQVQMQEEKNRESALESATMGARVASDPVARQWGVVSRNDGETIRTTIPRAHLVDTADGTVVIPLPQQGPPSGAPKRGAESVANRFEHKTGGDPRFGAVMENVEVSCQYRPRAGSTGNPLNSRPSRLAVDGGEGAGSGRHYVIMPHDLEHSGLQHPAPSAKARAE